MLIKIIFLISQSKPMLLILKGLVHKKQVFKLMDKKIIHGSKELIETFNLSSQIICL